MEAIKLVFDVYIHIILWIAGSSSSSSQLGKCFHVCGTMRTNIIQLPLIFVVVSIEPNHLSTFPRCEQFTIVGSECRLLNTPFEFSRNSIHKCMCARSFFSCIDSNEITNTYTISITTTACAHLNSPILFYFGEIYLVAVNRVFRSVCLCSVPDLCNVPFALTSVRRNLHGKEFTSENLKLKMKNSKIFSLLKKHTHTHIDSHTHAYMHVPLNSLLYIQSCFLAFVLSSSFSLCLACFHSGSDGPDVVENVDIIEFIAFQWNKCADVWILCSEYDPTSCKPGHTLFYLCYRTTPFREWLPIDSTTPKKSKRVRKTNKQTNKHRTLVVLLLNHFTKCVLDWMVCVLGFLGEVAPVMLVLWASWLSPWMCPKSHAC